MEALWILCLYLLTALSTAAHLEAQGKHGHDDVLYQPDGSKMVMKGKGAETAMATHNKTASDVAVLVNNVVASNLGLVASNIVAPNVVVAANNAVAHNVSLAALNLVAHNASVIASNVVGHNVFAHAHNIVTPGTYSDVALNNKTAWEEKKTAHKILAVAPKVKN